MTELMRVLPHGGWSDEETAQLWQEVRACNTGALPLRVAFDNLAQKTGRKSNSIRNYYYAAIKSGQAPGGVPTQRSAPFVPFTGEEIDQLLEKVLTAQGQGVSVRACVTTLADGDKQLALRLQNKYRALLKSHPDKVMEVVRKLENEGKPHVDPYRKMRSLPRDSALHKTPTDHIVRHLMLRTEGMNDDMTRQYLALCLSIADILTQ